MTATGTVAASVATGLSSVLAGLTPGQLFVLGQHLTASQEMQALNVLSAMRTSPVIAASLFPSLSIIPNLPPQVLSWVTNALSNPANFQEDMTQAQAALQAAAVHPGILGNLGL